MNKDSHVTRYELMKMNHCRMLKKELKTVNMIQILNKKNLLKLQNRFYMIRNQNYWKIFKVIRSRTDGNWMFDSFDICISGRAIGFYEIRLLICEFLHNNPILVSSWEQGTVDDYIEIMRKDRQWGLILS